MKRSLNWWLRLLAISVLAFFSVLMLDITLLYTGMEPKVGFLMVKQREYRIPLWRIAFFAHVFTSMFALVAGFTQFFPQILRSRPKIHRGVGKMYIAVILFVSGPAGLFMAFHARGGLPAIIAFVILANLWLIFTFKAYSSIRNGLIHLHRDMMIRSYALTLSAITLRSWKWILAHTLEPRPIDLYIIVAWLGFIPNILFAEWLIRRLRNKGPRRNKEMTLD